MLQSSTSELGPICTKRGHYGLHLKWITIFLAEITKTDNQLSETFCFIKISYVLAELWIFFYLEWCFLSKKVSFLAKTAVGQFLWRFGVCRSKVQLSPPHENFINFMKIPVLFFLCVVLHQLFYQLIFKVHLKLL